MRKDVYEAVKDRLRRITDLRDPSLALAPEALEEAAGLDDRVREANRDGPVEDVIDGCYLLGWLLWYRYVAGQDTDSLDRAIPVLAVCFAAGDARPLPEPLLPLVVDSAAQVASGQLTTIASEPPDQIDAHVGLWERIVECGPADGPGRGQYLSNLGVAVAIRHELTGSVHDLRRALAVCGESIQVTPFVHPLWARFAGNLVITMGRWFLLAGSATTSSDAVSHLDEGIAIARKLIDAMPTTPVAVQGERCRLLSAIGVALRDRAMRSGSAANLDEAIAISRQALDTTPPGHDSLWRHCANLSSMLRLRYLRQRSPADLTEAIALGERAIEQVAADDPERGEALMNLAGVLHERYRANADPADLAAAVSAARQSARAMPPGHRSRAVTLGQLCLVLRDSYLNTGRIGDLEQAAEAAREAAAAAGSGATQRRSVLVNAALALHACAEHLDDLTAADEAVVHSREVLQLASVAGHGRRVSDLVGLAAALETRHRLRKELGVAGQDGACRDLDEAIAVRREALRHGVSDPLGQAHNHAQLAVALQWRVEILPRTGGSVAIKADLDEAIGHGEAAARLLDGGDRPAVLANLSHMLQRRSELVDDIEDLDLGVAYGREAANATADDRPELLRNLADGLRRRGARLGRVEDLDEAVALGRRAISAVRAVPSSQTAGMLPALLSDLGDCLRSRSELTGSRADLNEAIVLGRSAVDAVPPAAGDRLRMLNRLGAALFRRARTGSKGDLIEAIGMAREVVASLPATSPMRADSGANLGAMLWALYETTRNVADLDEAITLSRDALRQAAADDDPYAPAVRGSNLGAMLRLHYKHTGDAASLDEAITLAQQAVQVVDPGHPDRLKVLFGLGLALWSRADRDACDEDRQEAARMFAEAADVPSASAASTIQAAQAAASLLAQPTTADHASWERAAQLLEAAVLRLPKAAPRRLERRDQQATLATLSGLAADAAALALDGPAGPSQRAARALQLLELGRAVLISQALDARTDLTDLHAQHPKLAQQFEQLRDELDAISDTGGEGPSPPFDTQIAPLAVPTAPHDHRVRTALALEATVARIRELPGHETFMLPPAPELLTQQAAQGPIAQINISHYRSDAILVTTDGIRSLALPGLDLSTVVAQTDAFYTALADAHDAALDAPRRIASQHAIGSVLEWLWDEAARPILDELGFGPRSGDDPLPRMWWILGGPLSLMPIHAAGRHTEPPDERSRQTVLDRVISSYTPTVRALGHARQRAATRPVSDRALIVAMPTTPDADPLPYAGREAEWVRRHYPNSRLLMATDHASTGAENSPVKHRVVDELPHCAVVHFACHGYSDPVNPSEDRLLLQDHQTSPLTVTELARHRLGKAQLAYLSACRTALSSAQGLVDEAIHLTSAFQLAGYPHVIGTLWEVLDEHAARIADAFHHDIAPRHGSIRTAESARALHDAVRTARDRFARTPTQWACHVHFGA